MEKFGKYFFILLFLLRGSQSLVVPSFYSNSEKILSVLFFLIFSNSAFADDKMALGLEVYNKKAQCGVCHTLQAAGSEGDIGPNLDLIKPQEVQVFNAVSNGIGVMQAWKGILTDEEIEAVAYYVFNSTNK